MWFFSGFFDKRNYRFVVDITPFVHSFYISDANHKKPLILMFNANANVRQNTKSLTHLLSSSLYRSFIIRHPLQNKTKDIPITS